MKQKGDEMMTRIGPMVSAVFLFGSLAGSALAVDGVLLKDQASESENYCHMKFPAIRPSTLDTDHPQLKRSNTGDVIDYYGACDESPTGTDQVIQQKQDEQIRFGRDYED
jgi:hypothetical protein